MYSAEKGCKRIRWYETPLTFEIFPLRTRCCSSNGITSQPMKNSAKVGSYYWSHREVNPIIEQCVNILVKRDLTC